MTSERLERLRALEEGHFWSIGRDRLSDNLVERHRMRAPFVDVGAGTAAYARRLPQPTTWIDIGPVEPGGMRAEVTNLPLADASCSTLLLRDVLEHVDDRAALTEAHRVLRPGGHLLVTVPGWPSLWGPRDTGAGHLRRYRRRGLRQVVENAGFVIEDLRGYQFFLLPGVVAMRWAGRARGDTTLEHEEKIGRANGVLTAINTFEVDLVHRRCPPPPTGSSLALVAVRP